jgi:DNA ligase (NAD+)
MDIEGLGERTVFQLSDAQLVRDPADIYSLTVEQLLELDGFAKMSAEKLVSSIQGSRSRPLPRLLTALGIKGLGPAASETISRAFGNLDAVMNASQADLAVTPGVGPTIAASIARWFEQPAHRQMIEKLRTAGVEFGNVEVSRVAPRTSRERPSSSPARSTASPARRPRAAIKGRGGKSPGSVSAKTYAVVAGADPGRARSPRRPTSASPCSTRPPSRTCSRPASCRPLIWRPDTGSAAAPAGRRRLRRRSAQTT